MKLFIFCLLVASVSILACNNNKPKTMTIKSDDGKSKISVDVNSAAAVSNDMQKKMEELKKLTPLTTDQLKTMLPEQLMGMKRSSFNANSMIASASSSVRVGAIVSGSTTIPDCAFFTRWTSRACASIGMGNIICRRNTTWSYKIVRKLCHTKYVGKGIGADTLHGGSSFLILIAEFLYVNFHDRYRK